MKIEHASERDADELARLVGVQLAEHAVELDDQGIRRGLAGIFEVPARGALFVARDAERIIGFAVMAMTWTIEHGGLVAWLDELYVDPRERDRGVGQALLNASLVEARVRGCRAMELEVDEEHARAERLYARNAFARLRRTRWTCSLTVPPDTVLEGR